MKASEFRLRLQALGILTERTSNIMAQKIAAKMLGVGSISIYNYLNGSPIPETLAKLLDKCTEADAAPVIRQYMSKRGAHVHEGGST